MGKQLNVISLTFFVKLFFVLSKKEASINEASLQYLFYEAYNYKKRTCRYGTLTHPKIQRLDEIQLEVSSP